jgi:drug/metabolite transporter (DMT)-like permease
MQPKHWTAFIILGGVWSASFLWIKIALDEIGPNTLVAWRVLFGLLFAGGAVFVQRKTWPRDWAGWFPFLLLGITSVAIPFFLITWGELSIDSAVAIHFECHRAALHHRHCAPVPVR